ENFYDRLVECKSCHKRFREDHLLKGEYGEIEIKDNKALCPLCKGELTEARNFNLMFKTFVGPVEELASESYLRPETAQGIFINFKNILNSMRAKLPFGIAQIGKSFRNEITPKNFIFRIREFEQMEIEFFVKPEEDEKWFNFWVEKRFNWYINVLGIKKENLLKHIQKKDELAHYAKEAVDIYYKFPFKEDEIEGIANRTDYDLKRHMEYSKKDLSYFDEETKKKIIPYVIEPSAGVERILFALLCDVFDEDEIPNEKGEPEKRIVLRFKPIISPIEIAIFPLLSNRENIVKKSREVYQLLKNKFITIYDESGSIGRRYRRQDEIGTPYCITIDFQTLEDNTVTIRDRDTTKQIRVKIEELIDYLEDKFRI
ncbi:MAG: glycine--tRNA ligase, partial [candidate division WOR-3 bacterium]